MQCTVYPKARIWDRALALKLIRHVKSQMDLFFFTTLPLTCNQFVSFFFKKKKLFFFLSLFNEHSDPVMRSKAEMVAQSCECTEHEQVAWLSTLFTSAKYFALIQKTPQKTCAVPTKLCTWLMNRNIPSLCFHACVSAPATQTVVWLVCVQHTEQPVNREEATSRKLLQKRPAEMRFLNALFTSPANAPKPK